MGDYYFVSYIWRRNRGEWIHQNQVIEGHPIDWLLKQERRMDDLYALEDSYKNYEEYKILFYEKINEEKIMALEWKELGA